MRSQRARAALLSLLATGDTVDHPKASGKTYFLCDSETVTTPEFVSRIAEAMQRAVATSRVLLVTGGLGPTPDDLTREAFAEFAQSELLLDDRVLAGIQQRFADRGYDMPAGNEKQAKKPRDSVFINNPLGTAPAISSSSARRA